MASSLPKEAAHSIQMISRRYLTLPGLVKHQRLSVMFCLQQSHCCAPQVSCQCKEGACLFRHAQRLPAFRSFLPMSCLLESEGGTAQQFVAQQRQISYLQPWERFCSCHAVLLSVAQSWPVAMACQRAK